jgi:hypothetical protein
VVQNEVVPAVPGGLGNFGSWLNVLDIVALLKPRLVMPTHSRVGDGSLIAREKTFISTMRARTVTLKSQGIDVDEAVKRVTSAFEAEYPGWAKSKDWDNVGGIREFVREVYMETN